MQAGTGRGRLVHDLGASGAGQELGEGFGKDHGVKLAGLPPTPGRGAPLHRTVTAQRLCVLCPLTAFCAVLPCVCGETEAPLALTYEATRPERSMAAAAAKGVTCRVCS